MKGDPITTGVASASVVEHAIETGAVLMDVTTGDCFELNRTGVEVWRKLKEGMSVDHIVAALAASYGVPAATLESDVRALLENLMHHGLIA